MQGFECPAWYSNFESRGAVVGKTGKTGKTLVLPRFCRIKHGGGNGGMPYCTDMAVLQLRRAECTEEGADGGNAWFHHNWDWLIVWNLSQTWIGKTLLDQIMKIVSHQQILSLCDWDTLLVENFSVFEIFKLCRMKFETIFWTKERR